MPQLILPKKTVYLLESIFFKDEDSCKPETNNIVKLNINDAIIYLLFINSWSLKFMISKLKKMSKYEKKSEKFLFNFLNKIKVNDPRKKL